MLTPHLVDWSLLGTKGEIDVDKNVKSFIYIEIMRTEKPKVGLKRGRQGGTTMLYKDLLGRLIHVVPILFVSLFRAGPIVGSAEIALGHDHESEAIVNGGIITGVVRFPGEFPEREKITITKDKQTCGAFQFSEVLIVSEENRGVQNMIIYLDVQGGKKAVERSTATLDQKGCRYIPRVQAIPVGAELEILNNDGILHNVHAYLNGFEPKHTIFNKAQPKFLKRIKQSLDKPGIYYFRCDVHDHMSAYIAVMDHSYYSVTDGRGKFTITDVPPGTYKVKAWHESLGASEKQVTVDADKSSAVNFDILSMNSNAPIPQFH